MAKVNKIKEVINRKMDILSACHGNDGDFMAKSKQQREIGIKIFFTFIAVYGFLAFLNPIDFPITRTFVENTEYFYIAQLDQIFGVALTIVGLYLLQEK
jgi:hypothetical protein